jgi:hypothetical protein
VKLPVIPTDKSPTDYSFRDSDTWLIGGLVCLPHDMREQFLRQYAQDNGVTGLISFFNEFIALARSLEDNTRQFIGEYLIAECNHEPETVERLNLPTLLGAVQGMGIAIPRVPGMCDGCAFRKGTAANQSIITTADARDCTRDAESFHCHEHLDEHGNPTRKCAGYAVVHSRNVAV